MIDLFSKFGTSTALLLRRKSKRWTSFKRFVSKKERTWRLKNLKIKEKIYKKQCLPVITSNEKHLPK